MGLTGVFATGFLAGWLVMGQTLVEPKWAFIIAAVVSMLLAAEMLYFLRLFDRRLMNFISTAVRRQHITRYNNLSQILAQETANHTDL